jgi:hypothetical protein
LTCAPAVCSQTRRALRWIVAPPHLRHGLHLSWALHAHFQAGSPLFAPATDSTCAHTGAHKSCTSSSPHPAHSSTAQCSTVRNADTLWWSALRSHQCLPGLARQADSQTDRRHEILQSSRQQRPHRLASLAPLDANSTRSIERLAVVRSWPTWRQQPRLVWRWVRLECLRAIALVVVDRLSRWRERHGQQHDEQFRPVAHVPRTHLPARTMPSAWSLRHSSTALTKALALPRQHSPAKCTCHGSRSRSAKHRLKIAGSCHPTGWRCHRCWSRDRLLQCAAVHTAPSSVARCEAES